jgi:hypothetical protein
MKLHVLLAATAVVVVSACGQAGRNDEVRAPDDLAARARVTEQQARATALSEVPGGEIAAGELEEEGGKLIWSFDIRVDGQSGVEEVQVDALDGTVVSREHESAAKEADEADTEGAAAEESGAPPR